MFLLVTFGQHSPPMMPACCARADTPPINTTRERYRVASRDASAARGQSPAGA